MNTSVFLRALVSSLLEAGVTLADMREAFERAQPAPHLRVDGSGGKVRYDLLVRSASEPAKSKKNGASKNSGDEITQEEGDLWRIAGAVAGGIDAYDLSGGGAEIVEASGTDRSGTVRMLLGGEVIKTWEPRPPRRMLIIGSPRSIDYDPSGHDQACADEFKTQAPSNWTVDYSYKADALDGGYVRAYPGHVDSIGQNYDLICRVKTGNGRSIIQKTFRLLWEEYGVPHVGGHGTNENERLEEPDSLREYSIGVGSEGTSWGPGLEVVAQDSQGRTEQSYVGAYVAGVMARLYEEEGSWEAARERLREMGGEDWSERRGFGHINPN